jgi:hypothetical protein
MKKDYQNHATPDDESGQTRRRVVKGLAGLPAMVTLASGSSVAHASSYQCVEATRNALSPSASQRLAAQSSKQFEEFGRLQVTLDGKTYQILRHTSGLAYVQDGYVTEEPPNLGGVDTRFVTGNPPQFGDVQNGYALGSAQGRPQYKPLFANQDGELSLDPSDGNPVNCSCVASFANGHT